MRYPKPLLNVPSIIHSCDGCGASFSLDYALVYKKDGLIIQRHNEIRDDVIGLAALVWGHVASKPVIRDASVDGEALIADLGPRGVWEPQTMLLFDIYIVDTDTRACLSHFPIAVLALAEAERKRKYNYACIERHAIFTPLCFLVDGNVSDEAACFLKHLARSLSVIS